MPVWQTGIRRRIRYVIIAYINDRDADHSFSDCGCFSGGKCKCATKKSPKMEPKQLDAVSELSSPGSTLNTASPAQFSVASDMPWSGNTTPGSNFASLGALPEFDPSSWGQATTQLDLPGGFDAGVLHGNMTTIPEATNGLVLPDFDDQQIQATMPDFSQMADWPNMDEGESKQLLAMMNNPANMEMGAFDPNTINMLGMGSADPGFGLDFASLPQQPTSQEASTQTTTTSKCGSKPEKECGPCCG